MENHPPPQDGPIETCRRLLKERDFVYVRFIVHMKRLLENNRKEFNQIQAICDVLIAAENRLPNGFMDYYGMLRVTRSGPVSLDDFKKLMKLLDEKENCFPYCQEAAQGVLQAWSFLSEPHMKAEYDLALLSHEKKCVGD